MAFVTFCHVVHMTLHMSNVMPWQAQLTRTILDAACKALPLHARRCMAESGLSLTRPRLPVLLQGYDIIEDMYSPKTSATNFVHELCTCRGKENLAPLLQLIKSTFDAFTVSFPRARLCR